MTELTKTREPLPVIVPLEFLEEGRFEPSIKRFRGRLEKWKCLSQADRVGVEDKISLCFVGCQEHIALARTQRLTWSAYLQQVTSPEKVFFDPIFVPENSGFYLGGLLAVLNK